MSSSNRSFTVSALAVVLAFIPMAQAEAPASPLIRQINNGNWLAPEEAQSLRDELYYQRAVFAYMTLSPALNTIGMKEGSEKAFGAGYNILPIWKQRMDSRTVTAYNITDGTMPET
ncbi:MAG TPA: hypothetical protein VJS90_00650, partial [Pseudomonas sp.]|nr:hypothetical protein [Pseudomonas sp.]